MKLSQLTNLVQKYGGKRKADWVVDKQRTASFIKKEIEWSIRTTALYNVDRTELSKEEIMAKCRRFEEKLMNES